MLKLSLFQITNNTFKGDIPDAWFYIEEMLEYASILYQDAEQNETRNYRDVLYDMLNVRSFLRLDHWQQLEGIQFLPPRFH